MSPAEEILQDLAAIQSRLDRVMARARILLDKPPAYGTPPAVADIQAQVARSLGLPPAALLGRCRRAELVWARTVAVYLCRKLLRTSTTDLGRYFARDHSAITATLKRMENEMDPRRKAEAARIEAELLRPRP